jgi:hypothetical protein
MDFSYTKMNGSIPEWAVTSNQTQSFKQPNDPGVKINCRRIIGDDPHGGDSTQLIVDPSYNFYNHCDCTSEYLGAPPSCNLCQFDKATCLTGLFAVPRGQWVNVTYTTDDSRSSNSHAHGRRWNLATYPCPSDTCCPRGGYLGNNRKSCPEQACCVDIRAFAKNSSDFEKFKHAVTTQNSTFCANNRDPHSRLCSQCLPGYHATFGTVDCISNCHEFDAFGYAMVSLVFLVVFLLVFLLVITPGRLRPKGSFVIATYFFQTVGMLLLSKTDDYFAAVPTMLISLFTVKLSSFGGKCVLPRLTNFKILGEMSARRAHSTRSNLCCYFLPSVPSILPFTVHSLHLQLPVRRAWHLHGYLRGTQIHT